MRYLDIKVGERRLRVLLDHITHLSSELNQTDIHLSSGEKIRVAKPMDEVWNDIDQAEHPHFQKLRIEKKG